MHLNWFDANDMEIKRMETDFTNILLRPLWEAFRARANIANICQCLDTYTYSLSMKMAITNHQRQINDLE